MNLKLAIAMAIPLAAFVSGLLTQQHQTEYQQTQDDQKTYQAEKADEKKDDQSEAVKNLVSTFFENWEKKKATQNATLFFDEKSTVVRLDYISQRRRIEPEVTQHNADKLLRKWETNPPSYLKTNRIKVDVLSQKSLAIATVDYSRAGIKGQCVFTFGHVGGNWKIVSLVDKVRFNW